MKLSKHQMQILVLLEEGCILDRDHRCEVSSGCGYRIHYAHIRSAGRWLLPRTIEMLLEHKLIQKTVGWHCECERYTLTSSGQKLAVDFIKNRDAWGLKYLGG